MEHPMHPSSFIEPLEGRRLLSASAVQVCDTLIVVSGNGGNNIAVEQPFADQARVRVRGGSGNDSVFIDCTSNGTIDATIDGGRGFDGLTVNINTDPMGNPLVFAAPPSGGTINIYSDAAMTNLIAQE